MIGGGLGAEKVAALKTKRLKRLRGRVSRMGKSFFPCKLGWLFCKYCVSTVKVASVGLRVSLKTVLAGDVATAKFSHKPLAAQE